MTVIERVVTITHEVNKRFAVCSGCGAEAEIPPRESDVPHGWYIIESDRHVMEFAMYNNADVACSMRCGVTFLLRSITDTVSNDEDLYASIHEMTSLWEHVSTVLSLRSDKTC